MYGRMPVLADSVLDDATIQTSDLVLVGSAEENTAVLRITAGFPATVTGATVTAGTETWPLTDATVGILGRNAATPSRLVYWVVSSGHDAYAVTNLPFKVLGYDTRPAVCPDLLITANGEDRLIAARRLTGRWTWCPPAGPHTALTGDWITPAGLARLRAACLRLAVRTDAALCLSREPETGFRVYPAATAETTRIEDVAALQGDVRVMIIEPTGAELEKLLADKTIGCVMDGLDEERLESTRRYRVACIGPDSWAFLRVISDPDLPVSATSVDVGNAIRTHAGTVLNGGK
jgi:hypothetical protein